MGDGLSIGSKIKARVSKQSTNGGSSHQSKLEPHNETSKDLNVPVEICVGDQSAYKVGDRVEARYRGRGRRFYAGKISGVLSGDRYDIAYDDGDQDRGLASEFIRRLPAANIAPEAEDKAKVVMRQDDTGGGTFQVGQRVEARYRGRGRRFYKGTIASVLPGGLYDVNYDDGDKDKNLHASAIRTIPNDSTRIDEDGAKSPQIIKSPALSESRVSMDPTLSESRVSVEPVKPLEDTTPKGYTNSGIETSGGPSCADFKVGQTVEARYKGRGRRWYKGTVTECFPNGTCNITYNDGDKDYHLATKYIRARDVVPSSNQANASQKSVVLENVADEEEEVSNSNGSAGLNKVDTVGALTRPEVESMESNPGVPKPKATPHVSVPKHHLAGSEPPSIYSSVSAADGDVSFVAPIQGDRKETVNAKRNSVPADELSSVDEVASEEIAYKEDSQSSGIPEREEIISSSGKGNRLYRGVVSKVKVVHLYEIEYPDGTKDVNIPFQALRVPEEVEDTDIQAGAAVDVLSWQDRFWTCISEKD